MKKVVSTSFLVFTSLFFYYLASGSCYKGVSDGKRIITKIQNEFYSKIHIINFLWGICGKEMLELEILGIVATVLDNEHL